MQRTLSTKTWRGSQSLDAERIEVLADGTRVRAVIHRDAYDNQSYARVQAWTTDNGWQTITSTPIGITLIHGHSYVEKAGWQDAAASDMADLIAEAAAFMEGA